MLLSLICVLLKAQLSFGALLKPREYLEILQTRNKERNPNQCMEKMEKGPMSLIYVSGHVHGAGSVLSAFGNW